MPRIRWFLLHLHRHWLNPLWKWDVRSILNTSLSSFRSQCHLHATVVLLCSIKIVCNALLYTIQACVDDASALLVSLDGASAPVHHLLLSLGSFLLLHILDLLLVWWLDLFTGLLKFTNFWEMSFCVAPSNFKFLILWWNLVIFVSDSVFQIWHLLLKFLLFSCSFFFLLLNMNFLFVNLMLRVSELNLQYIMILSQTIQIGAKRRVTLL